MRDPYMTRRRFLAALGGTAALTLWPGLSPAATAGTDLPVLRDVTQNGAVYFDPTQDESIAATLLQALNDQPLRQAVIERGLRRARYFTWDRAVERMLKIYAQAREA